MRLVTNIAYLSNPARVERSLFQVFAMEPWGPSIAEQGGRPVFNRADSLHRMSSTNVSATALPQRRIAEHKSLDTYRALGAALAAWIVAVSGWALFQIPDNSATLQLPGVWKGETVGGITTRNAHPTLGDSYELSDVNLAALDSLFQRPGSYPLSDRLAIAAMESLMHLPRDVSDPTVDVNVVRTKAKMQVLLIARGSWGGGGGGGGAGEVDLEAFEQALRELLTLPHLLFHFLDLAVLTEKLDALLLSMGNLQKGDLVDGNLVELNAEIDKIDVKALKEKAGWSRITESRPHNIGPSSASAVAAQHDGMSTPNNAAPPQSAIRPKREKGGGVATPIATAAPVSDQPNRALTATQEANTQSSLSNRIGKTVDAVKGGNKFEPGSTVSRGSGQTGEVEETTAPATAAAPPDGKGATSTREAAEQRTSQGASGSDGDDSSQAEKRTANGTSRGHRP
jgi:hypothetical protein